MESNPSDWLSFVAAELEWGRQLDVEADRLGQGARLSLEAKLRSALPWGLWLELEQQIGQGFVRGAQGRRGFTERNARTLAVLHFSARDSLRSIVQDSHYQRRAEGLLPMANERSRLVSLVFQHRTGLARVFSLGLSQSRVRPQKNTELFAKALVTYP